MQRATTAEIMDQIDGGASLLTFFGHSAVGTFDFSLEDPSKYNNKGRNPIILSLGCHSGNIHTSAEGVSEEFVLESDNGAIAFIASSGTAYPEPQYKTGISIYELLGEEMYGAAIGDVLQRSLEMRTTQDLVSVQTLIEQLTLHGDPAYRPQTFEGPDYVVDENSLTLTPSIVNANTPRVSVSFDVVNLGRSQPDVLDVYVIHQTPNGIAQDTQHLMIPSPASSTTINLDILNPGEQWIGNNRILIKVDPTNGIHEMPNPIAERNNELIGPTGEKGTSFYVFDNSAKPVYPTNFGILSDDQNFGQGCGE